VCASGLDSIRGVAANGNEFFFNLESGIYNDRYLSGDFLKIHLVAVVFVFAAFVAALAAATADALPRVRVNTSAGFLKFASFFQEHFDGDAGNGQTY
jgi:hypothetical protein